MRKDSSDVHAGFITLEARPQPIHLPLSQTAVLVVDMQNDFAMEGGLFERAGIDISTIRATVAPTARVLTSARTAGLPIVYIQAAFRPNLSDLYQPGSPLRERFLAYDVGEPARSPDGRLGRILIRDTWNTEIIDELKPETNDVVVVKHGFGSFHETELDAVLKGLGVKYLIVTGCTTSVCVETAIREAHVRDYACILLEDCTAEPIGAGAPGYIGAPSTGGMPGSGNYAATLLLVQTTFGWVSNSGAVVNALQSIALTAVRA
jgi:ureidoacrylate peracid hydrolase